MNEPDLELPNAFSPAGDGIGNGFNDTYVIGNLGLTDDESGYYPPCYWDAGQPIAVLPGVQPLGNAGVRNRRRTEYRNDWNGRNNNDEPLVDGTYFVLLRLGERKLGQYVDLRNDK